MKNVHLMKYRQAFQRMVSHLPNSGLVNYLLSIFMLSDHLEDISALKTLRYDTEGVG